MHYILNVSLNFSAPPEFLTKPEDIVIGLNGIASFECVASGNPPPSIFWAKEGSQILMFPENSYGPVQVTQQGTLQIRGVQNEDSGYFVCSALSVAGSATTRAFLQVSISFSPFEKLNLNETFFTPYSPCQYFLSMMVINTIKTIATSHTLSYVLRDILWGSSTLYVIIFFIFHSFNHVKSYKVGKLQKLLM